METLTVKYNKIFEELRNENKDSSSLLNEIERYNVEILESDTIKLVAESLEDDEVIYGYSN